MPDNKPTTQVLYETCDTSNLKDIVTTTDIKEWKLNKIYLNFLKKRK